VTEYLTVAVVADELGLSMRTIQRYVQDGEIPAVKLPGGRLRISRRDLDSALSRWSSTPQRRLADVHNGGA
jgi:excisionase family DNA binding protein